MISGIYGEYYRYPLRTQPHQKWTDEGFSGLPGDCAIMTTLVFRICNPRYANMDDYHASKPTIEWECMACAEAGNKWIGVDPEPHFEAHQMGFDYAIVWLDKQKAKANGTSPDYRGIDCENCGRMRVQSNGVCEKCGYNNDTRSY